MAKFMTWTFNSSNVLASQTAGWQGLSRGRDFAMLNLLKDFGARKRQAGRLYDGLVSRAREPVFFTRFGVADSLDGRFDMLAFHAWLVLTELKGASVAQDLTNLI